MLSLDDLDGMTTAELRAAWEEDLGRSPPARASAGWMRSVLAYRIQGQEGPRLSNATKRELERIARALEKDRGHQPKPTRQVKAGTKLLREWNGVVHEVLVLDDGAEYRGTRYPSLTAVAKEITGAHWSGPWFFGLKARGPKKHETTDGG